MPKDVKKSPKSKKDKGTPSLKVLTSVAPKEKRAASPYNLFMQTELPKVKKANPSLNHKEAFKAAAQNVRLSNAHLIMCSGLIRTRIQRIRSKLLMADGRCFGYGSSAFPFQ